MVVNLVIQESRVLDWLHTFFRCELGIRQLLVRGTPFYGDFLGGFP